MSDPASVDRHQRHETDLRECKKRVEDLEIALHDSRLWRTGNGNPHRGAEYRISELEEKTAKVDRLDLPEKFHETRAVAFDVRDAVKVLAEKVQGMEERAVSSEQLEMFMTRVIATINAKIGEKDKTKAAKLKAFAPYFVSLCTLVSAVIVAYLTRGAPK